jgi:hypothetical protein
MYGIAEREASAGGARFYFLARAHCLFGAAKAVYTALRFSLCSRRILL